LFRRNNFASATSVPLFSQLRISDITSERFALLKMSDLFFSKAVVIFIKNRTVRQNTHGQNVIFNCHRIFEITLDEKLSVVLSKRLKSFFPQITLEQNFVPFENKPIRLPEKLAEPDSDFLRFHREEIFQS
jgi:hypothetical protein